MKCPVCDKVNTSMLCPNCGFDSSRDYGKYPTFGPLDRVPSVSALRKKRQELTEEPAPVKSEPPVAVKKKRKLLPLLVAAAVAVTLGLGVWIGSGLGSGTSADSGENVQMQEPPETTVEPGVHTPAQSETSGVYGEAITPDDPKGSKNVLRARFGESDFVYGTEIRKEVVQTVTFLDTQKDAPDDAWDVSLYNDRSVLLWAVKNGEFYDLFFAANGGVNAGISCERMFDSYVNLKTIDFSDNFQTEDTKDMSYMFWGCESLTSLDLSGFNTESVRDMSGMFENCTSLSSLGLSGFNTGNVLNMSAMFYACEKLKSLDLSNFDTGSVTDMNSMFCNCKSLTSLDLSAFNTGNVWNMVAMFRECTSLRSLDISNFDTRNVKEMGAMFYRCYELKNLDLSSFDTVNVEDMTIMFKECPAGDDWQHLLR